MNLSIIKKHKEDFLFLPLSGVGEIGVNCYLYQLQGKWLLVDLGIGFSLHDPSLPGIDVLLPDIAFLKKIKDDLLAIVVTHSHEDHCGAIHHLWEEIGCPVYADEFTIQFIRNKCAALRLKDYIDLNVIGDRLKIGPFDMEFIHMTHSTPFMNGIVFRTEYGNFFHTGDWKIDEKPIVGKISDLQRLQEIQEQEGFKGAISDSTNATVAEKTLSESSLIKPLQEIFSETKGLIAVTLFASNVDRLRIFCDIAKQFKRKIAVFGRSLHNIIGISHNFDIFKGITFIDENDVEGVPRDELLIMCTGCQGEELAAMSTLASDKNRFLEFKAGDTAIFSSKTIPGNELSVTSTINKLILKGVHIINEKSHHVHVSGHPGQEDLKILYDILKPEFVIPMHGEPIHLFEHMKFARSLGIKSPLLCKNGDIVQLNAPQPEKIGHAETGFFCLDGKFDVVSPDDENIRERGILAKNGVVFIALAANSKMKLLKSPKILTFGILNYRSKKNSEILKRMTKNIESMIKKEEATNVTALRKKVRSYVRNICRKEAGKLPVIEINIDVL